MYVYVISAGPEVQKIGITNDLDRRRSAIACASGRILGDGFHGITPHARAVEREMHGMLRSHRIKGEWFAVSAEAAERAFDEAWERVHGFPLDPYAWIDPFAKGEWKAP